MHDIYKLKVGRRVITLRSKDAISAIDAGIYDFTYDSERERK